MTKITMNSAVSGGLGRRLSLLIGTAPLWVLYGAEAQEKKLSPRKDYLVTIGTPAGDMITKVLEGQATPAEAAKAACETINNANKK